MTSRRNCRIERTKLRQFIQQEVDLQNRRILIVDEHRKRVSMNLVVPRLQKEAFLAVVTNFEWSPFVMGE